MSAYAKLARVLPNSVYARELQDGAGRMRFSPEIEAQYRAFFLAERRTAARSFNLIMLVCALGATVGLILLPERTFDPWEIIRVGIISVIFVALVYVAYSEHYATLYMRAADTGYLLISGLLAFESAQRIAKGQGELLALMTTFSFVLFYLPGLLFYSAVRANVALVVSLGIALILLGQPAERIAFLLASLAATGVIVGLTFRQQGIRFRRAFLERCLIGEVAARDWLTGLNNRGAFDEHLVRTWQQALRDRRSLVLLLIDVDHFKAFNDRYGHQAGDSALQSIAKVVNGMTSRPFDFAARYGGEEFAMILYDPQLDHARKLAEELRAGVQALGIEHQDSEPSRVATISIGVAIGRPTLRRGPDGLIQLADQALYAAKGAGRNRVTVFEGEYATLATGEFRVMGGDGASSA